MHFYAQFARHLEHRLRLFFAQGKVIDRRRSRFGVFFAQLVHERIERGKRTFFKRFRAGEHRAPFHAAPRPIFEILIIVFLRFFVDAEQVIKLRKFFFAIVEIGEALFDLFVCKFMIGAQLIRFVEHVRAGEAVAVFFGAVFHDEQKRLLLHRVVFQKFQNALHFVGLEVLARFLEQLVKLFVELRVFFGANGFGSADRGVHGQVFHEKRFARENAYKVAVFPKSENFE